VCRSFLRRKHGKELTATTTPFLPRRLFVFRLVLFSSDFGECSYERALAHQLTVTHAAGDPGVFAETCSGICYNDYVIGSPSNYDNAYFEVRSVRVFGTSSAVDISNSASGNGKGTLELVGLVMLVLLMAL